LQIFEFAYQHEKKVTKAIHDIYHHTTTSDIDDTTSAHRVAVLLQWFVTEQIEEEATSLEWLEKIDAADKNYAALLVIDQQMGER